MALNTEDMVLRLLFSFIVGWVLGKERKIRQKPVGSRTHIIICLAATVTSIISAYGFEGFQPPGSSDPARLMVGIITGMGFIGAGIIWKDTGGGIQGITTAANVFLTACLGLAIGLGYYLLVALATIIAFITLELSTWKIGFKKAKTGGEKTPLGANPNWNYEIEHNDSLEENGPPIPLEEEREKASDKSQ